MTNIFETPKKYAIKLYEKGWRATKGYDSRIIIADLKKYHATYDYTVEVLNELEELEYVNERTA